MTNHKFDPTDPFADLDDSDFESAPVRDAKTQNPHVENIGGTEIPGFVEDCPKCRGTGTFYSYTGRPVGPCHKCKGKGKLTFKTAPAARAKARASAQKRKTKDERLNLASMKVNHPAEYKWLRDNEHTEFAASLLRGVAKYASLTEKQLAAVRKAIAREQDAAEGFEKWAEANAEIAAWLIDEQSNGNEFANSLIKAVKRYGSLTENQERAVLRNLDKAKTEKPSDLDISSLKGYYAVPGGKTRLKIRVRKPGKNSKFYGWTFVDDGAEYGCRKTYGKQAPDGLYAGEIQDELRAILADPMEAQVAYGKLTGVCGHCGRKLEDEQSVAAGIGPVCAAKYG